MVKDSHKVVDSCQPIARELSELAYSVDREGEGNTEIVDDWNSVE